ncbi:MAG TPA: excalibur calcium-binding domain-containing protein [Pseudomonadota bacterium]|nr:excalibur calcium-binding domain-containing protein [Pseudomonadota bacterium]
MRKHGTLVRWNADRGFGFVELPNGGGELFVHVTEFQRGGAAPRIGELISFNVQDSPDGRKRAVNIMRAGEQSIRTRVALESASSKPRIAGFLMFAVVLGVVGFQFYKAWPQMVSQPASAPQGGASRLFSPTSSTSNTAIFRCDGRQHCSQMHSCAEATYFLRHCPGTKMDGDGDGVACEQQWCGR